MKMDSSAVLWVFTLLVATVYCSVLNENSYSQLLNDLNCKFSV